MKYLFGPVNSRRLGISLGIDLLQRKICTLDCVYCECGHTSELTEEIDDYSRAEDVIGELDEFLASGPRLDAVTFSGSGEPTLCRSIGEIIDHLKTKYPQYKIVVLTNGTLLYLPEVRERLKNSDVVIPSLDAVSIDAFQKIYKPAAGITPEKLIDGIRQLRKEFSGKIIIEIFIIPGINDSEAELNLIKKTCEEIAPDGIQLNTLDRPSAEKWIRRSEYEELEKIRDYFKPLKAEIIGKPSGRNKSGKENDLYGKILSTIRRRPSTAEDLYSALGADADSIEMILKEMKRENIINAEQNARGEFYVLSK